MTLDTGIPPVLFENDDFLAINKPEGLSSIPDRSPEKQDLHTLLLKILQRKILVVHRLDKEVSGVMLFAKTDEAHKYMNGKFESREVKKTYLALVHGKVKEEFGQINKPIREFGSGRMGVDEQRGKSSITDYEVTEYRQGHTLIKVRPVTGRRHQIRVHLYAVGHAIAGDTRYGDPELQKKYPRLMLHSNKLEFIDPAGSPVVIDCPLPPSFRQFLDSLPRA